MPRSAESGIKNISADTLALIVRSILESESAEPTRWSCESIHGSIGEGTAIYRIAGEAIDTETIFPWSVVLKILAENLEEKNPRDSVLLAT